MLLVFLLLSSAGGLLTAGFAMPFVGAASALTNASAQLFDELPDDFNVLEPSEISVIRASNGQQITQFYAENRIVVPLSEMSVNIQNAIIAVEDQRFYQHKGVDPAGIVRAVVSNANSGDTQGASTLTQQYVRNVLIEAGLRSDDSAAIAAAKAPTVARKLREIKYALTLEQKYTKQQVLEGYLNIAAFGPSTYGVEASSRYYFSHSAAELTIPEAALLAGITNAPGAYDPETYPDKAKSRMDWVLKKMYEEQFITEEDYQAGLATQISDMLRITSTPGGCAAAGSAAYFCEYVVSEIENSELYGASEAERRQLLLRGGLDITTTIDLDKQAAADAAVQEYVPTGDASGVKAALASVEPGTGRILALSQNTTYGEATSGDSSTTQISLNVDASHGGMENSDGTSGFQPGSTFKAFVLAQWYASGRSGYETMNTDPTTFPASTWTISCDPSKADSWKVGNANSSEGGTHNVIQNTAMSINVGYARMTSKLDICDITGLAAKMGVTNNGGEALSPSPSIALGSQEVTPLQMANAYATFAASGLYCKPIAIDKIVDTDGNEMPVPSAECTQAMDATAANRTTATLQQVLTSQGTGRNAILAGGRPAAGKTGTTERMDNAWFVGYTPQLAAAVWLGHSEGYSPMDDQWIGGRYYSTMYGSDAPAPLWKMYMDAALGSAAVEGFPQVSLGAGSSSSSSSSSSSTSFQSNREGNTSDGQATQEAQEPAQPEEPVVVEEQEGARAPEEQAITEDD